MENKDFSKNILNKIKKENIKQVPKYLFVTKNILVWLFLVISIILWALSISISFEYLINIDWELSWRIWVFKLIFMFLPIFWVIFLVLSSFLSFYNYRHTEKWYKLTFLRILGINILFSFIVWVLFVISGFNNYVEVKIEEILPKYRSILVQDSQSRITQVWQNEDNWLLIWEIINTWEIEFQFKDSNDKIWNISVEEGKTDIRGNISIKVWQKIKIIWEKIDENNFYASIIKMYGWKWNNRNR